MTRPVFDPTTPEKPTSMSIAGVIFTGVAAVIVFRIVLSIVTGLIGLVIPAAIVGGGAYLVTRGHKAAGWTTVIVGLLIFL